MSNNMEQRSDLVGDNPEPPHLGGSFVGNLLRIALQMVVAALLIFAAISVAKGFMAKDDEGGHGGGRGGWGGHGGGRRAALVEVVEIERASASVVVEASGTVVPALEIALHPQVTGEVVEVHPNFAPGGFLSAGETVVRIDDDNYRLASRQADANRDAARASQRLEEANQLVARAEYELYGGDLDGEERDLVLREPQLASAEASLEAADAAYDRARLNLRRTQVTAPFDSVVHSRSVNVGSRVGENSPLARLIGTGAFWIEAAVPVEELDWLTIPTGEGEIGSEVRVFPSSASNGDFRVGHVVRLLPDLEDGGRLAKLLIEVTDPMALLPENTEQPRLLLGAWARVEIQGTELESTIPLDRSLVRGGNSAWVLNSENTLEIRPLDIVFRGRDQVFVSGGVEPGENVISSALSAPVPGMQLRTGDSGWGGAEGDPSSQPSGGPSSQPSDGATSRPSHAPRSEHGEGRGRQGSRGSHGGEGRRGQ